MYTSSRLIDNLYIYKYLIYYYIVNNLNKKFRNPKIITLIVKKNLYFKDLSNYSLNLYKLILKIINYYIFIYLYIVVSLHYYIYLYREF